MDWQGWFSLALVAGVLGTLTLTRLKPHVVMMGALTLLVTFGVLSGAEALAGFANEGLIIVAAMFVVAAGIHASGGAAERISEQHSGGGHHDTGGQQLVAQNRDRALPTDDPLSYASIFGGTMTLVGTSTNLMVYGPGGYTFAEFLRVGIPMNLAVGSFTLAVLLLGWPLEKLA